MTKSCRTKVFISYCHKQREWIWDRLVPCLKAGGVDYLIDRERFEAGKTIIGQMDETQDKAEKHILVLSKDYLNSKYCRHEMDRAIQSDPDFEQGNVIPVKLDDCKLPRKIKIHNPLYVDMQNDKDPKQWDLFLSQCNANLGISAPKWLKTRDEIERYLKRNESVNLVVDSNLDSHTWKSLIDHLAQDRIENLAVVDLEKPETVTRSGLLTEILNALGSKTHLPNEPNDLPEFSQELSNRKKSYIALKHFDLVPYRENYEINLFTSLKYMTMDAKTLVLLVHSHTPFASLLPQKNPLSKIDIKTVELG